MNATEKDHDRKPVHVRFPEDSKRALKLMADSDGMTVTAWLVHVVKNEARRRGIMAKSGTVKAA